MDNNNFLDELLSEIEKNEQSLELSHADLLLKEISNLEQQIKNNFIQADEEKRIIHEWGLSRDSKQQSR